MIYAPRQLALCPQVLVIRQPRPLNTEPKVLALELKGFRRGLGRGRIGVEGEA